MSKQNHPPSAPTEFTTALQAPGVRFDQDNPMTDFQSFRNAVLEDDDLQEAVISIINTATANGSGGWQERF